MDKLSAIPGNYGWPVVGNTVRHFRDPIGFKRRMRTRYGDVYRNYVLFRRTVVLLGEEANREVLTNRTGAFSSAGGWNQFIGELFPGGLMLMDGERHRQHRNMMNPDFTRSRNAEYAIVIRDAAMAAVAALPFSRGELDIYRFAKRLTLRIALDAFFGISPDDSVGARLIDDLARMVAASYAFVRTPFPGTPFAAAIKARARLLSFLHEHAERLARENTQSTLFARMIADADGSAAALSRGEVIEHLLFLVMASHDTTASAITSTLYFLARHQDWQSTVAAEALGSNEVGPLLDVVCKEALRLYPPVPELPRTTTRDVTLFGHFVPAGTRIGISPSFTHRMDEYWDRPEEFDPTRFEASQFDPGTYKFRYIPFGGGPHHCLGFLFGLNETRIVVSELLRRYALNGDTLDKTAFMMFPFPHPVKPLRLRLAERE